MSLRIFLVPLAITVSLVSLLSCGDDSGGPSGTFRCTTDEGCDDRISCTVDTCGVDGTCRHTGVDERCGAGMRCDVTRGCAGQCERNEDCDDSVECTLDTCAVGGVCQATPVNERCPSGQTCNATTGCGTGPRPDGGMMSGTCASSAECDDDIDCTLDTCGADMRCQHLGQNARCGSGEMCNPLTGCARACDPGGPASQCDDGVLCNGMERCDPEFGCSPAEFPEDCNDGDACTVDRCDTVLDECVRECNTADASCADEPICAEPPPTMFPATYDLMPPITHTCSSVGEAFYTIGSVTFDLMGPVLTATVAPMPRAGCATLSQTPAPTDGTFDVECEVSGGCVERFRLTGRFVEPDGLEAMFSATYTSTPGDVLGCGEGLGFRFCSDQTVSVTGRRRP